MRWFVIIAGGVFVALAGCKRAQPSDVGEQARKDAGAQAMSMASERAYQANPTRVPPSAMGTPVRLAPQH